MSTQKKKRNPGGNSRAAQNKKIRRDALREELKSREYLRFIHDIAVKLNPKARGAFKPDEVIRAKARADIYLKLLDKCLPSLRPVDMPISIKLPEIKNSDDALSAISKIISNVSDGKLNINQAKDLSSVVEGFIKTLDAVAFESRLKQLEEKVF